MSDTTTRLIEGSPSCQHFPGTDSYAPRPTMFVSIPAPEMSLPMSRQNSTSYMASGLAGSTVVGFQADIGSGSRGISALASLWSRASCRKNAGRSEAETGTASSFAVWW